MSNGTLSLFVLYTIGSGSSDDPLEVTREQMKGWLADAGIDPAYLPAHGRSVDAFRSATSTAADSYDYLGTSVRLVVRETAATKDVVTRRVFQTWIEDGAPQERLVATLQFFRPHRTAEGRIHGSERMRWRVDQRLSGFHKGRVSEFVARLKKTYELRRELLSPHAVRAVVRTYLTDCGAVAMSEAGGGAYLVDPLHADQVKALQAIVMRCGPRCRMRVIPILDEPDLREMVLESADADIAARASAVFKEVSDWMASHPGLAPATTRWTSWMGECRVLQDRLVDYMERFEDAQFPTASQRVGQLADLTAELGLLVTARIH